LTPEGKRVDKPFVTADVPSRVYQIGSSAQVEISAGHVPANKKVKLFAADEANLMQGETEILLASDWNPSVTITLERKSSEVLGRSFVLSSVLAESQPS
jgi:hypothetical protein